MVEIIFSSVAVLIALGSLYYTHKSFAEIRIARELSDPPALSCVLREVQDPHEPFHYVGKYNAVEIMNVGLGPAINVIASISTDERKSSAVIDAGQWRIGTLASGSTKCLPFVETWLQLPEDWDGETLSTVTITAQYQNVYGHDFRSVATRRLQGDREWEPMDEAIHVPDLLSRTYLHRIQERLWPKN